MKNIKKYFLLLLVIMIFVSITSISASEDNTETVDSTYESNAVIDVEDSPSPNQVDTYSSEENNELTNYKDSSNSDVPKSLAKSPNEDEVIDTTVTYTSGNHTIVNEKNKISARVLTEHGMKVPGGHAILTILKDKKHVHSDIEDLTADSTVSFKWTPTKVGIYNISIEYCGYADKEHKISYAVSVAKMSFEVNEGLIPTNVTFTSSKECKVSKKTKITGKIKAEDGTLVDGDVLFKIFNKKNGKIILEEIINIKKGSFSYYWVPKEIGNYIFNLTYKANGKYNSSYCVQDFKVNNISNLKLIVNDVKMEYLDGTKLVVKVLNEEGKAESNLDVNVKINGKKYEIFTNKYGLAKLTISLNPNTYNVLTSIPGTNIKANSKLTITKWDESLISLIPNNLVKYYKSNQRFKVTLKYKNRPIAGEKLSVNIGKLNYTITTNNKGVATLKFNFQPGNYKVKVSANASGVSSSRDAKIVVKKWKPKNVKLTVEKIVKTLKNGTKYDVLKANLSYAGNAISNEPVYFTFNNKIYKSKTNNEGVTYFTLHQKNGIHINSKTKYAKLKVKKTNPNGLKTKLTYRGYAISKQPLYLTVNNELYKSKTDNDGVANFKLHQKLGPNIGLISTRITGTAIFNIVSF